MVSLLTIWRESMQARNTVTAACHTIGKLIIDSRERAQ
jgi:hypothetical protein